MMSLSLVAVFKHDVGEQRRDPPETARPPVGSLTALPRPIRSEPRPFGCRRVWAVTPTNLPRRQALPVGANHRQEQVDTVRSRTSSCGGGNSRVADGSTLSFWTTAQQHCLLEEPITALEWPARKRKGQRQRLTTSELAVLWQDISH